jgi:hypothetical protein
MEGLIMPFGMPTPEITAPELILALDATKLVNVYGEMAMPPPDLLKDIFKAVDRVIASYSALHHARRDGEPQRLAEAERLHAENIATVQALKDKIEAMIADLKAARPEGAAEDEGRPVRRKRAKRAEKAFG